MGAKTEEPGVQDLIEKSRRIADSYARYCQEVFPGIGRVEAIKALRAEQSLHEFMVQAWPHVEGSTYIDGEHIRQVCLHLQAFSDGWVPNLGMCIPPRYCKSSSTSVFFPAWEWARNPPPGASTVGPRETYLTLSYREELAVRDNWRARTLMNSAWYQARWGRRWKFSGDQNVKKRYANKIGGQRIASAMSSVVGSGGSRIVIDDPQSYEEALNRDASDKVVAGYQGNLSMRSFGDVTRKVCMMQRLSFHDLMAYLMKLAKDGLEEWVFLILPIIFTPNNVWKTYIGVDLEGKTRLYNEPGPNRTLFGGDWRSEAGEPLWPELYGGKEKAREALLKVEARTPDAIWSAQGLQDPMPPGGGPYKSEDWFPTYERLPTEEEMGPFFIYSTWDCAIKDKEVNDPTAGYLMAYYPRTGMHFVLDRYHFREQFVGQEPIMQSAARKVLTPGACHVVEGGGNGSALVSALNRWMDEYLDANDIERSEEDPLNRFYEWMPKGLSKMGRATIASPRFREKRIYWPAWAKRLWLPVVIKQFLQFPYAEHDDDVDAINQGIIWVETEGLALFLQADSDYQIGSAEDGDYEGGDFNGSSEFPDIPTVFNSRNGNGYGNGRSRTNSIRDMVGLWMPGDNGW